MMRFSTRRVPHRRRREQRTDYKLRFEMLKSGKPRLVIRKSASNVVCQIIKHERKGDKTVLTVSASDLRKAGWKAHCGSIPASYLTGLICGKRAREHKVSEAIADLGIQMSTKGAVVYAAVKGALDGGLKIPHSEDILPPTDRVSGKHVEQFAKKLRSENPGQYKKQFAVYVKAKFDPETLSKHFEEIKKKILK
jgi:large subunit ribosomal protein L18